MEPFPHIPRRIYYLLFALLAVVYILAMLVPVMEVDAAQYASISEQMLREDSFLVVKHRENEYLDKPPLLFWLSAWSMKVLGISSFAYKLPSVFGLVLAIFSTYKFTRLRYTEQVARAASLILASSLCFLLMANDVRTDNLLVGFSMLAIWKMAAWLNQRKARDLYMGFAAIGLAMLAKGPLGLVFTMFTVGSMLLIEGKYKLLSWKWLWGLPIIALILIPMCIGLYRQHGIEGLEFFFWKQSFGRITGESEWSNNTDPFFLVHTFLWAFIPWCILFVLMVSSGVKSIFRGKSPFPFDIGSFGGLFLTMIALSFSRYKLPHYIYIVTPLAAVLCAQYLDTLQAKKSTDILSLVQLVFCSLLLFAILILTSLLYDWEVFWSWLLLIPGIGGLWYFVKKHDPKSRLLLASTWLMITIGIGLLGQFYPRLLQHQSSSEAAFFIKEHMEEGENVLGFHSYGHAFTFYMGRNIPVLFETDSVKASGPGTWIYTNDYGLGKLKEAHVDYTLVQEQIHYPVQFLKADFINPLKRSSVLKKRYILYLK